MTLPNGFHLIELGAVGSTNDEAKSLAINGANDGTVVRAASQTAGRGRHGRTWVSELGNLYFSLLVRPACPPQQAVQLSFVTAVALAETLSEHLPKTVPVTCKWPNDILVGCKKIAGMLLESAPLGDGALDWLVIGIGLNVGGHPSDVMYPATSVHAAGAPDVAADELLAHFCRRFAHWRTIWIDGG
ncbi:MAG: biotin--[acetyl-CoA-carboxylase] ligase, partial [Rhodospirillales bacterium]|nr:biotin--[acetyl-CoA-carboxylase] ligase [Rhodospirillales bacterium]